MKIYKDKVTETDTYVVAGFVPKRWKNKLLFGSHNNYMLLSIIAFVCPIIMCTVILAALIFIILALVLRMLKFFDGFNLIGFISNLLIFIFFVASFLGGTWVLKETIFAFLSVKKERKRNMR